MRYEKAQMFMIFVNVAPIQFAILTAGRKEAEAAFPNYVTMERRAQIPAIYFNFHTRSRYAGFTVGPPK